MRVAALLMAAVLAAPPAARAEGYPERPVRLVVGFGAGGPTDIPARFLADKLTTALGQRVFVENKPAASGLMATRDVLHQKPDGYSLLLCTHFEATNTVVYKDPGYTLDDIAPVSLIARYYYGLALSNSIPAADFKSFVAYAKAHPDEVNYATVGVGSAQQVLARQLAKMTGIQMLEVPFQGGATLIQELVAGRINLYVSPTLAIIHQYEAQQLKILAVTAPTRLASLAQVPTLREEGLDFVRFGWLGVCAPKGLPKPITATLNREIAKAVATPEYKSLVENAGSLPESSTPEGLGKILQQTADDIRPTILEFGLEKE
ncbi:MAG: tripartite tricarboxylate transporter substrate binding protein [Alphaproteobacteria bacterium]|nr:tripartite tricarboxylate transporter substrate binding protein [Alphaproteobacteria bacterium]